MVRKANMIQVNGLAGGKGIAEVHHIVENDELGGVGRLYGKVVLKPGSSVGWHKHTGETEPYYILKGNGVFIDNDESRTEVGPGDCCIIEEGQCHSIENTSENEDLEFMALIYNII